MKLVPFNSIIHDALLICSPQDQKDTNRQQCSGMYSRKSWGGSVDPFILLKFVKPDNIPDTEDPIVSLVVFEWRDHDYIGKPVVEGSYEVSCPTHLLPLPPSLTSGHALK